MDNEKTTFEPTESPIDSRVSESPSPSPTADYSEIVAAIDDLKAVVGDVSSTIISRFAAYYNSNYTGGLNPPDYIIWRNSQYDYYMLVLTSATYSNGQITGSADLVNYHVYSGYDTMPSFSITTIQDRYIDIPAPGAQGSAYVYSSIDGYVPASSIDVNTRFEVVLSFSMAIMLLCCVIFVFIKGVFFRERSKK